MNLTEDEQHFLSRQGLSECDFLDARSMSKHEWLRVTKEQNKQFIIGSRCRKEGHRLRTRAGHCIQCDTSKIAYSNRYYQKGYVYIAGSLSKKLIKVGGTKNIDTREETLRFQGYGGAFDWEILFFFAKVDSYGRIERDTQRLLAKYKTHEAYIKDDKEQSASEVFKCSFSVAKDALSEAMGDVTSSNTYQDENCNRYEFS